MWRQGVDAHSRNACFQETSIASVSEEVVAAPPPEEIPDIDEEETEEEAEAEVEVASPEKSPRDGATSGTVTQPEITSTKIRFDDFLNLMEVF